MNRTSARSAHARLELRREQLIKRLEALRPATKANRGYRSAKELLGSRYIRASMAARVTLIEAADFLVRVLEMMPLV